MMASEGEVFLRAHYILLVFFLIILNFIGLVSKPSSQMEKSAENWRLVRYCKQLITNLRKEHISDIIHGVNVKCAFSLNFKKLFRMLFKPSS